MGRKNRQRSELRAERTFFPEFGARHPVSDTEDLAFFFDDLDAMLREIIPPATVPDSRTGLPKLDHRGEPRKRNLYRLYDDVDRSGVSVLERRLAADYARKHRVQWTKQDVGRITGQIQNEIGRLDLAERRLPVALTNVVRLGDADAESQNARKLALIVDQASDEAEFLVREHAICVSGVETSLKRFRYPYSTFIPHMTVGRVFRDVPLETLNQTVSTIQELLPLEVELQPIQFTLRQEI